MSLYSCDHYTDIRIADLRDYGMNTDLMYSDITERIIGSAFKVHSFLGNGFQEVIYQRALALEMESSGLNYEREKSQPIYYRDIPFAMGSRRADFIVEDKVLVEIKAVIELEEVHVSQVLNYLKAYQIEVGLLVNFGSKSMTFRRLVSQRESVKSINPKNQRFRPIC